MVSLGSRPWFTLLLLDAIFVCLPRDLLPKPRENDNFVNVESIRVYKSIYIYMRYGAIIWAKFANLRVCVQKHYKHGVSAHFSKIKSHANNFEGLLSGRSLLFFLLHQTWPR